MDILWTPSTDRPTKPQSLASGQTSRIIFEGEVSFHNDNKETKGTCQQVSLGGVYNLSV